MALNTASTSATTSVVAWGDNTWGQTNVPAGLTNVLMIAAGWGQSLALRADGTVVAWGGSPAVTNVPGSLTNVVAIAAGGSDSVGPFLHHSLALKADGTVMAWGDNYAGQKDVPEGLSNVVAVAAGGWHNLALRADGTVVAWGDNHFGQTNVPPTLSDVVAISAGRWYSLALRSDGAVVAWGDTNATFVPTELGPVVGVSATDVLGWSPGGLALKPDGTVVGWGGWVDGLTEIVGWSNVTAIANTMALKTDGTVLGLDLNYLPAPLHLTNVLAIAEGYTHSLALIADGPLTVQAQVTGLSQTTNGFCCQVISQSGRTYRLEYKDSLADDPWSPLALVAGNGGLIKLTDPVAQGSHRFYRVRRW